MAWRRGTFFMASLHIFLYFGAGVLLAFFSTVQIRLVAQCKKLRATVLTFFLQLVNLFVLAGIITQINAGKSLVGVIIYALGISAGTYVALRFRHLEGEHEKS